MNLPTQTKEELEQMAEFYAKYYDEVYFVRCLKTGLVVAVECAPVRRIERFNACEGNRRTGVREIYGYQNLLLSTRERLDKTPAGNSMIGYEARTGNDTRLSPVERGVSEVEIAESLDEVMVRSLSPFELAKIEGGIIEAPKKRVDYRLTTRKGMEVEKFETFEIERVK